MNSLAARLSISTVADANDRAPSEALRQMAGCCGLGASPVPVRHRVDKSRQRDIHTLTLGSRAEKRRFKARHNQKAS